MKYNTKAVTSRKTVNLAGGEAYTETPKLALVSLLLTSFVKNQFYRKEDQSLRDLEELMEQIPDKKFVAKAAIYARTKYGMRSISHATASLIAQHVKGEEWTKTFFDKIVYRPDDMMEILANYYNAGNKNEPNALKKGFAQALQRFDEYQLGKYRGEKNVVSLVDVVNLTHPKSTPALRKLVAGQLRSTDTWETRLTQAGQKSSNEDEKAELKKEAWVELITTRKLGYFALLRNLRNILEQSPDILPQALEMLMDENLIKKSLVLPFRFTTALREIAKVHETNPTYTRSVFLALNRAVDISLANVPELPGKTVVVVDGSGSMQGQPIEIGSLFAAVLAKANNADLIIFDTNAKYFPYNPADTTLTLSNAIMSEADGGGTDFSCFFRIMKQPYNRIIILSDMQGWVGYNAPKVPFRNYKERTGADPFVYSFDLQGYGTLQFPESKVAALAGFSEKVFDVMKLVERDPKALINEIEKVTI